MGRKFGPRISAANERSTERPNISLLFFDMCHTDVMSAPIFMIHATGLGPLPTKLEARRGSKSVARVFSAQGLPVPREPGQPDACRCLLRQGRTNPETTRGDQTQNHAHTALAPRNRKRINSINGEPEPPIRKTLKRPKLSDHGHAGDPEVSDAINPKRGIPNA
jgi:hypothetical protein